MRVYTLTGHVNLYNILKSVGRSMLIFGPSYAFVSTYFTYIPKEKYWEKLEIIKLQNMKDFVNEPRNKSLLEEMKSQNN